MAKAKTIENLFNYLAFYSAFIPVFFFFFFFKKSRPIRALWVIITYCTYNFLTDFIYRYIPSRPSELFIYSLFTFVEYYLFTYALYIVIKNQRFKRVIIILGILFTIFLLIYDFTATQNSIDSIPIGMEAILVLIFSFYYLFERMNDTSTLFIYNHYSFWIILGMLLYLAGSFFIYIFSAQLLSEHRGSEVAHYWIFTNIFSILKNIFFAIAIIINAKQSERESNVHRELYSLN